jgi:hypothetical protein
MPVHDWTRIDDGTFHAFHTSWNTHLLEALNGGLLPADHYALSEQVVSRRQTDVLTLHASRTPSIPPRRLWLFSTPSRPAVFAFALRPTVLVGRQPAVVAVGVVDDGLEQGGTSVHYAGLRSRSVTWPLSRARRAAITFLSNCNRSAGA